jgi:sec-independent protein translocase protein TatB
MPPIGPLEILVVGVLALIVFGPNKLPEMARSLGKGLTQLKQMSNDVKSEFDMGMEGADGAPEDRPTVAVAEETVTPARS